MAINTIKHTPQFYDHFYMKRELKSRSYISFWMRKHGYGHPNIWRTFKQMPRILSFIRFFFLSGLFCNNSTFLPFHILQVVLSSIRSDLPNGYEFVVEKLFVWCSVTVHSFVNNHLPHIFFIIVLLLCFAAKVWNNNFLDKIEQHFTFSNENSENLNPNAWMGITRCSKIK